MVGRPIHGLLGTNLKSCLSAFIRQLGKTDNGQCNPTPCTGNGETVYRFGEPIFGDFDVPQIVNYFTLCVVDGNATRHSRSQLKVKSKYDKEKQQEEQEDQREQETQRAE